LLFDSLLRTNFFFHGLLQYPELQRSESADKYVPRLHGFRIRSETGGHQRERQQQHMDAAAQKLAPGIAPEDSGAGASEHDDQRNA